MAKLIYVSNNAINRERKAHPLFQQERDWLTKRFGFFSVICDRGVYDCDQNGNLTIRKKKKWWDVIKCFFSTVMDQNVYKEIHHMIIDHKISLKNTIKVFLYSYRGFFLYYCIQQIAAKGDLLYSFWFSYDAYACAKIHAHYPSIQSICRAHAYEIQLNRNACNPYLMKRYTCEHLDKIYFISHNALQTFTDYYHYPCTNAVVEYLGSTQNNTGYIERNYSEELIILTCSSILPIKRLDRLVNVLSNYNSYSVHWIHIGDGPDKDDIFKLANAKLKANPYVTFEFTGYMNNSDVHSFLKREDINIFLNVSDSEGVPVSIMEAMSTGLPVIAPRIYGIPELVDNNCGFLFDLENAEEQLCEQLTQFYKMGKEERNMMGRNAYDKWKRTFCLETNLSKIFYDYVF